MGLIIPLVFMGIFLCLGLFVGGFVERKHLQDLTAREEATRGMLVTQIRSFPAMSFQKQPTFVCGEVVISSDYFKNFLTAFRKFFGGELRSFRTIMDRARREALLRLKEEALRNGYDAICNVRMETASIGGKGGSSKKNKLMMASIIASGTAYCSNRSPAPNQLA